MRELELIERRNVILQRLARLDVRAPVDGVVYGLNVFARKSVIRAADPLLYLIPQNQPLVISTQVAPSDIDQVYLNQRVSLNFSSFNQRTTPTLFGRVSTVSADSFQDQQTGQSYFVVEIRLDEGEAARLPEGNVLVPGDAGGGLHRNQQPYALCLSVAALYGLFEPGLPRELSPFALRWRIFPAPVPVCPCDCAPCGRAKAENRLPLGGNMA